MKDIILIWLGDKQSKIGGKVECGRGRHQCGIHPTFSMNNALDQGTNKLGEFINGNDKKNIWDAMLNKMVQGKPQFLAGSFNTHNDPANNAVGISQPFRGTNDDILFIIDHLHADEEDADKEAEEGTTSLIDQYRDELEAYKKLPKRTMGNCPLKWWRDRNHRFPTLSKLAQITCVFQ